MQYLVTYLNNLEFKPDVILLEPDYAVTHTTTYGQLMILMNLFFDDHSTESVLKNDPVIAAPEHEPSEVAFQANKQIIEGFIDGLPNDQSLLFKMEEVLFDFACPEGVFSGISDGSVERVIDWLYKKYVVDEL